MASTLAYLPHVKGSDVTNKTLTKMCTDQSFYHCSPGWRTDASKKATRPPARLEGGGGTPVSCFPKLPKITFKKGLLRGY